jgi:hypothetical protein
MISSIHSVLTRASSTKRVLVVTQGTGKIASAIVQEALKRQYEVVWARSLKWPESPPPVHHWAHMNESAAEDAEYWKWLFEKISDGTTDLSLVNTLGIRGPFKRNSTLQSLQDEVEKPLLAAIEALKSLKMRKRIGQISTIAASNLDLLTNRERNIRSDFDPRGLTYCLGRRRIDSLVNASGIPATILRHGFVFTDAQKEKNDDSPEQFTKLLIQPMAGSGEQIHQPVYMKDLVQALFNGMESDQTQIVDAVGPDTMTLDTIIQFFVALAERPTSKPIKIPPKVAEVIAEYFPKGTFVPLPQGPSLLRFLERNPTEPSNTEPFKKLVGKPLTSLSQIDPSIKGRFIFRPTPIIEHVEKMIKDIASNSQARRDFLSSVMEYGPDVVLKALIQTAARNL